MNETCSICERVSFGELTLLGYGKWRHAACCPGSQDWIDYYRALPKRHKTLEGNLLLEAAVTKAKT